jgi:lysophospholipase L1-like esterase
VDRQRIALHLGRGLILLGLIVNVWTVGFVLSPSGSLDSLGAVLTVALIQLLLIAMGLFLLRSRPAFDHRRLLLLVGSVLLALLLAELAARVVLTGFASEEQLRSHQLAAEVHPDHLQWSPHHYLTYSPTPNFQRGKTSHNSLGYRGPEISVPKPEDGYRIVLLGGSSVYTVKVLDNLETFPVRLQAILRDKFNHPSVEVINAGVAGYNSWESLINLQFRVLDLDPDLIIIYHGTNDVLARMVTPGSYQGDNSGRRSAWQPPQASPAVKGSYLLRVLSRKLGWSLFEREGLGSFVNAATYEGVKSGNTPRDPMASLDQHPPTFFRRNLVNMIAIAKAHAIEVVLSTWAHSPLFEDYASTPPYRRGFQENNEVVSEVAREQEVLLFDFVQHMSTAKEYWFDGRHVNEAGALLKAQLFAEFLDQSGIDFDGR